MSKKLVKVIGYRFRSDAAVRYEESDYSISEYDKWGRLVFHLVKDGGYWSMRVFAPIVDGGRVSMEPLQVFHKYWFMYNLGI